MGAEGERKEIWTRGDGSWAQVEGLTSQIGAHRLMRIMEEWKFKKKNGEDSKQFLMQENRRIYILRKYDRLIPL